MASGTSSGPQSSPPKQATHAPFRICGNSEVIEPACRDSQQGPADFRRRTPCPGLSRAAGAGHRATSQPGRWCRPPCHVADVPLVPATLPRRSRAAGAGAGPPCQVEAVPMVPTTARRRSRAVGADHRAASKACRRCWPTVPGRSRAAGAGHRAGSKPCRWCWPGVPRRGRAAGAGHRARSKPCRWCRPPCHVEAVPLVLAIVPRRGRVAGADHRAASKPCRSPAPCICHPQLSTLANASAESAEVRKVSIHAGLRPMASAVRSAEVR